MKYFEYVYVILMVMAIIFLSKEWNSLPGNTRNMLLFVTGIFGCMYAFRRSQRIRMEKAYEEEMEAFTQDTEVENVE